MGGLRVAGAPSLAALAADSTLYIILPELSIAVLSVFGVLYNMNKSKEKKAAREAAAAAREQEASQSSSSDKQ